MKLFGISALVLCACLASGVAGRELGEKTGRALLGCRAVAISRSKAFSEEKKTVAEAVSNAFAEAETCEDATAKAEATADALTQATAKAIAKTSALIEGDNCSQNSYANAKASAKAFATAISVAIATAIAEATNSAGSQYAVASPEDIKKVVETAIATSESTVTGTGEAASEAVAEAVAQSVANAVALAIAEVECEPGVEIDLPFASRSADLELEEPTDDPCMCSESSWVNGIRTNRPGCQQHALPNDKGFFCYAVGGAKCPGARQSKKLPGAYWRDC